MNWKVISDTIPASPWKTEKSGCIQVRRKELVHHCVISEQKILNKMTVLRTLRNSGLSKDLEISPCVVSKWVLSIAKLFSTGAFTSLKNVLSISRCKKLLHGTAEYDERTERLKDYYQSLGTHSKAWNEKCVVNLLSPKIFFESGIVLIKIRWIMLSTEKSINLDSILWRLRICVSANTFANIEETIDFIVGY